jgi:hypothetical protein
VNRRGFFAAIASAVLAGVALKRGSSAALAIPRERIVVAAPAFMFARDAFVFTTPRIAATDFIYACAAQPAAIDESLLAHYIRPAVERAERDAPPPHRPGAIALTPRRARAV